MWDDQDQPKDQKTLDNFKQITEYPDKFNLKDKLR